MTLSHEEHENIMGAVTSVDKKVDALGKTLEFHIAEGHELHVGRVELDELMRSIDEWITESRQDRKQLRAQQSLIMEQQDLLATVVLGEAHRDYDGEIVREGGMYAIVKEYHNKGGFKVSIPSAQIVQIIVALIAGFALVAAAVVQSGGTGVG